MLDLESGNLISWPLMLRNGAWEPCESLFRRESQTWTIKARWNVSFFYSIRDVFALWVHLSSYSLDCGQAQICPHYYVHGWVCTVWVSSWEVFLAKPNLEKLARQGQEYQSEQGPRKDLLTFSALVSFFYVLGVQNKLLRENLYVSYQIWSHWRYQYSRLKDKM